MRKIKQILSVALASTMLMGLTATSASAYDISTDTDIIKSTYKDENGFWTQLPFDKILTVDKDMNIPAGTTFSFSMEPRTVNDGDVVGTEKVKTGTPLGDANATVTISYSNDDLKDSSITQAVTDSTNVTVTKVGVFTLPTFTQTGIYRYTVKEVVPADNAKQTYITYDTEDIYRVDLYVTSKDVNNKEEIGISHIVAVDLTQAQNKDNIIFRNSIGSAGLTIQKALSGNGASKNDQFQFFIKIPEGGDNLTLNADTKFEAVYHKQDGSTEPVTINVAGEKEGNVPVTRATDGTFSSDMTGAQGFILKGGESLTFTNLPVGMIFYVTEGNYTDDGYTTTAEYVATGTGANSASFTQGGDNGTQTKGTIASGDNTMTFTNTKNLTPDTGINVDVLPYVLAMLLTVAGIVWFVFKKRRNTR
jgi:hypothetical protein